MAFIGGTSGADLIHQAGDGIDPLPGANDMPDVTDDGDTIMARGGDDIVFAGDGPNVITGGAGTDQLMGGAGADRFKISNNSDISGLAETVDGGGGVNTLDIKTDGGDIDLTAASLANLQDLSLTSMTPAGVHLLMTAAQITLFNHFEGAGPSTDHEIILAAAAEVDLRGVTIGAGLKFMGSSGNDIFGISGTVADTSFFLGGGEDTFQMRGTGSAAKTAVYLLDGGDGGDYILSSRGLNTITGDAGNDYLIGGKQSDTLDGGADNDRLQGRGGQDTLIGGLGGDTFAFTEVKDSLLGKADIIQDFSHADGDRIDLHHIDADITQAGNQDFHLMVGGFTHAAGELILLSTAAGHTIVEGDVDGDGVADFAIDLLGAPALTAADFIF